MGESYFFTAGLSVGYGQAPVVRDVTFSLERGEILTLIGPNGAGKSTLLKSIAGQLTAMGGTVYLNGSSLQMMRRADIARQMSVLLTDRLQAELLSCEQVVESGRYPYTGRFGLLSQDDHAAVFDAMECVHVTGLREQLFSKVSDGQKQRVLLARAIAQEPDILILDEPTSYLDIRYKTEFLSALQELCRCKNIAVLLSLHELELARRISDRLLCIRDGAVYRYGTPEEIFCGDTVRTLFELSEGSYDAVTDGLELAAPKGEPQVFVIGGCGSGRELYRSLQRKGIPFVTGILPENDLDAPVARALASEVIVSPAMEPADDRYYALAEKKLRQCPHVLCARTSFGSLEPANAALYELARTEKRLRRTTELPFKDSHL